MSTEFIIAIQKQISHIPDNNSSYLKLKTVNFFWKKEKTRGDVVFVFAPSSTSLLLSDSPVLLVSERSTVLFTSSPLTLLLVVGGITSVIQELNSVSLFIFLHHTTNKKAVLSDSFSVCWFDVISLSPPLSPIQFFILFWFWLWFPDLSCSQSSRSKYDFVNLADHNERKERKSLRLSLVLSPQIEKDKQQRVDRSLSLLLECRTTRDHQEPRQDRRRRSKVEGGSENWWRGDCVVGAEECRCEYFPWLECLSTLPCFHSSSWDFYNASQHSIDRQRFMWHAKEEMSQWGWRCC